MEDKKHDDGGPVSPIDGTNRLSNPLDDDSCPIFVPGHKGMTLLDYFAGQALNGILSSMPYDKSDAGVSSSSLDITEVKDGIRAGGHESRTAYAYASAMLAEKRRREAE